LLKLRLLLLLCVWLLRLWHVRLRCVLYLWCVLYVLCLRCRWCLLRLLRWLGLRRLLPGVFGRGGVAGLLVPVRSRVDRSGPVLFLGAVAQAVLATHCRHRHPFRSAVGTTVVRPTAAM
jgi:hypothetical protein